MGNRGHKTKVSTNKYDCFLTESLDAIFSGKYSVSFFVEWGLFMPLFHSIFKRIRCREKNKPLTTTIMVQLIQLCRIDIGETRASTYTQVKSGVENVESLIENQTLIAPKMAFLLRLLFKSL